MPMACPKNCARGGCYKVSIYGKSYCQEHMRQKYRTDQQIYKTTESNAIYKTKPWANIRKDILHHEPFCRECAKSGIKTVAVEIDHIKPIAEGGEKWDRQNMQPLCKPCHARKTAREVLHKD
ncbi:hypothetical protein AOC28_08200 [Polynucleobacter sp. MWH-Adler-W8]|nr:hypothetical protein AOC28_08200 [Polynucleobacter sp. MWH-Adler-W8]